MKGYIHYLKVLVSGFDFLNLVVFSVIFSNFQSLISGHISLIIFKINLLVYQIPEVSINGG